MRKRGATYWSWSDVELCSMQHTEIISGGGHIDVQARLSRSEVVQLFIGVYATDGRCLFEEYFPLMRDAQMSTALAWGIAEAKIIAGNTRSNWRL